MKLRISLTQKQDELRGKIECQGDGAFMLECIALAVSTLSKDYGVTPLEMLEDLKGLV